MRNFPYSLSPSKMKAGLYVRQSTGEQSHFSLEAQETELKRYCELKGYQIANIYSDTYSGITFEEREGLQNLLDDVEKGKIDIVLATEWDRLARDSEIIGYIKLTLKLKKIEIRAINEPELVNEYDSLINGVIILFSNFELKRRKRRCMRGIKKAREKGKVLNRSPKGYRFVGKGTKNSMLEVDEQDSQIVRDIFDRYAYQNQSMYRISKDLKMSIPSIKYILKNEFYVNKEYGGKHYPIIDNTTFRLAQQRLS